MYSIKSPFLNLIHFGRIEIIITPHSAAPTNIELACKQIIKNITNIEKNITLLVWSTEQMVTS